MQFQVTFLAFCSQSLLCCPLTRPPLLSRSSSTGNCPWNITAPWLHIQTSSVLYLSKSGNICRRSQLAYIIPFRFLQFLPAISIRISSGFSDVTTCFPTQMIRISGPMHLVQTRRGELVRRAENRHFPLVYPSHRFCLVPLFPQLSRILNGKPC